MLTKCCHSSKEVIEYVFKDMMYPGVLNLHQALVQSALPPILYNLLNLSNLGAGVVKRMCKCD